jgi:hypothetical protein
MTGGFERQGPRRRLVPDGIDLALNAAFCCAPSIDRDSRLESAVANRVPG